MTISINNKLVVKVIIVFISFADEIYQVSGIKSQHRAGLIVQIA
jgi:hypothetical protein